MEERQPRIYKDYEDYWRNGNHGYSSFSRDIVEDTWKDLEPTILANRTDWEEFLIEECRDQRRILIRCLQYWQDYLEEFNLEKVAGVSFHKWRAEKLREKWDKENLERNNAKGNNGLQERDDL